MVNDPYKCNARVAVCQIWDKYGSSHNFAPFYGASFSFEEFSRSEVSTTLTHKSVKLQLVLKLNTNEGSFQFTFMTVIFEDISKRDVSMVFSCINEREPYSI